VIKMDKFVISHDPYAVDLLRMTVEPNERPGSWHVVIPAVWFRRKRESYDGSMRTVACLGTIRDDPETEPELSGEFMAVVGVRWRRVEGDCLARWDGSNLWSLADESTRAGYLDVLRPMLENFPAVPPSYSGWWRYR
jgi:hypothetical protein